MATATALTTTRYVTPGVYIGQLIKPSAGSLTIDARVCNYIGQGSRLAAASNLGIRRSFVYNQSLIFPINAPFVATLPYPADGNKNAPVVIFDSITGLELRPDQWQFVQIGGQYVQVLVSPTAFDQNAQYQISYQSTSTDIQDPLPVSGLRQIKLVGTGPSRNQFTDFVDFFVPYSFSGPSASNSNSVPGSFLTSVFPDGANSGAGSVDINPAASFNHDYNRFYELAVIATSGGPGSFTATFEWSAARYSGGVNSLPPTPIDSSVGKPQFVAQEAVPSSLVQLLELGVKIDVNFNSGTNFSVGDRFYFNGVGPGLIEFDKRLSNSNQYLDFSTIVKTEVPGSTGTLSFPSDNTYNGTHNANVILQVTSAGGAFGSRFVNMAFALYGEVIGPTGSISLTESAPSTTLSQGISVSADFGSNNFLAGDIFEFDVMAPRVYYQAKDDRVYNLSIATATNAGADVGAVTGSFSTGTPEGGFGQWSASVNLLFGIDQQSGYFTLPDGVILAVRNAMRGNINGSSYAVNDSFSASISSQDVIDWSLSHAAQETRDVAALVVDVTGAVTGSPGTSYIILNNNYTSGSVSVVTVPGSNPVSFIEIPGTRFLAFVTAPTTDIQIDYQFQGANPAPGQLYYFTANYLRPQSMYNNPTLVLDRQSGRNFLAPSQTNNYLYIMNELVFDNSAPGAYYTQPYDQAGNGSLTVTDVAAALEAHKTLSRATDLCVLAQFGSLSQALEINETLNDPFLKKEQMLWVGAPIGTPIGDVTTQGSLVYLAQNVMQTTPTSPALGTRVLVSPTICRKTVTLDNGVSQQLTLDGSFVAGATSALVNSFSDPANTILRRNLAGFDFIQTYSEPENLILGQASITYMSDQGNGVYRFEEDITVHSSSEIYQLINSITQQQYVVKVVRRNMDQQLISLVTPSAQAAISLIRATLSGILIGLLGRGLIASYQDENGNVRDFDSSKDILITRDSTTLSLYFFNFCFFIRTQIKRLYGLYSVSSNDFGSGSAGSL